MSAIVDQMEFSVLVVCTGNICRSPLGERLLISRLDASAPIRVSSAGTHAMVGLGIDGPSALALQELGVDADGHVAQQLTAELVDGADLILTAESAHRSAIVQVHPLTFRTTFTLREFGRLGAGLAPLDGPPTVAQLRARVIQVAEQRGMVEAPDPGDDEVGDPFGAPVEMARQTATRISVAVDAIVSALGLLPRIPPPVLA